MKITAEWLKEKNACEEGRIWWRNQKESDGAKVVKALIRDKKLYWANWTIVRILDYKDYVSYGVYAAECALDIYEKEYPNDKRPRQAIEAARKCIENPSKENKDAANAANAAYAAYAADAACAAYAAYAANAADAACAAYAAANAADAACAANAAYAADAAYAAYAAAYAADAAYAAFKLKILKYGLGLLEIER